MFIPTNETCPVWDSDDAATVRTFVESSTGQKLLKTLAYLAPELLDGGDVNKTLVASGVVKGYALSIETMLNLQTSRPKESEPAPENYPSLDDETQWPDSETPTKTR